jgi:hypothetical protein
MLGLVVLGGSFLYEVLRGPGESSWVEMSVSFARRLRCFRVKIEDLQTAEFAFVKKDFYEVV